MTLETNEETAIYSIIADDPDYGELVGMYVEEMGDRIANLQSLYDSGDWQKLQSTAHQMKGAAGSYGFEQLTPLAKDLEHTVRDEEPEETILQSLQTLLSACRRVRVGSPG